MYARDMGEDDAAEYLDVLLVEIGQRRVADGELATDRGATALVD
jgi:hypothetical protein